MRPSLAVLGARAPRRPKGPPEEPHARAAPAGSLDGAPAPPSSCSALSEVPEVAEECVDLLVGADCDAEGVAEAFRGEVADEDGAFGEGGGNRCLVDAWAAGEDEVRRRRRDLVAELLECGREARACRADAGDVRLHVREIGERC